MATIPDSTPLVTLAAQVDSANAALTAAQATAATAAAAATTAQNNYNTWIGAGGRSTADIAVEQAVLRAANATSVAAQQAVTDAQERVTALQAQLNNAADNLVAGGS